MNWLDRARRELREAARRRPADTAETPSTAVLAVRVPADSAELAEALRDAWEERSAILEFDNGLTRAEAERIAWLSIYGSARPH